MAERPEQGEESCCWRPLGQTPCDLLGRAQQRGSGGTEGQRKGKAPHACSLSTSLSARAGTLRLPACHRAAGPSPSCCGPPSRSQSGDLGECFFPTTGGFWPLPGEVFLTTTGNRVAVLLGGLHFRDPRGGNSISRK